MTIVDSLTVPVPTRTPRARVGCRIPHPGRWGLSAGDPGSTRRQAVLPIFIVGTHPPVAQSPGGRVPQWSPRTGMAAPTAGPTPPTRPNPPSRRPCPRSPPCGPSSSSAGRSSGAALPDRPALSRKTPPDPPEAGRSGPRHRCQPRLCGWKQAHGARFRRIVGSQEQVSVGDRGSGCRRPRDRCRPWGVGLPGTCEVVQGTIGAGRQRQAASLRCGHSVQR